jgi:hypothetical protein
MRVLGIRSNGDVIRCCYRSQSNHDYVDCPLNDGKPLLGIPSYGDIIPDDVIISDEVVE